MVTAGVQRRENGGRMGRRAWPAGCQPRLIPYTSAQCPIPSPLPQDPSAPGSRCDPGRGGGTHAQAEVAVLFPVPHHMLPLATRGGGGHRRGQACSVYLGHQHSYAGWAAEPGARPPEQGGTRGSLSCSRHGVVTGFQIKSIQGSTGACHRVQLLERVLPKRASQFSAGPALTLTVERIFQGCVLLLCQDLSPQSSEATSTQQYPLPSCFPVAPSYFFSPS